MKAMGDDEQIPKDAAEIDAVSYGVARSFAPNRLHCRAEVVSELRTRTEFFSRRRV